MNQSRLYLLVLEKSMLYDVVYLGCKSPRVRKKANTVKSSSVLDCLLKSVREEGDRRFQAKLTFMLGHDSLTPELYPGVQLQ